LTLFALLLAFRHIAEAGTKFQKVILSVCLFILTVATLATQTRGTVLAMVIALFLMFFNFKNKKLMLIFFFFPLGHDFFNADKKYTQLRINYPSRLSQRPQRIA